METKQRGEKRVYKWRQMEVQRGCENREKGKIREIATHS